MNHRAVLVAVAALLVGSFLFLASPLAHGQSNPLQANPTTRPAGPFWPQFNGPRGDNRSSDKGLLKTWPAGGPRLVWRYDGCGTGFSSVALAKGMIFTAGDFDANCNVLALNMKGQLVWTASNGKAWKDAWPGSRCTPTYSDGMVYHLNAYGRLAAYDANTGQQAWSVMLKHERLSQGGYAESVIIDGNNLICMPGARDEFIVALDKRTGNKVWVSDVKQTHWDRASYVTPILVEHKNRKHIIHMSLFRLMCLDAQTGKVQWSVQHKRPKEHCDVVAVSPVWLNGRVFITKGYEFGSRVYAMDPSGASVTQAWEHKDADSEHAAAVADGNCIYVSGNYVYPVGGWRGKEAKEGDLFCLDIASGRQRWVENTGRVTVTYADGRLYCLDEFGRVLLIEASPAKCSIVGKLQISRANRGQTLTHPVVIGGRMYIRDHNTLYVYDVKG